VFWDGGELSKTHSGQHTPDKTAALEDHPR